MAGIDPNNLNQRLAEIHQALLDAKDEPKKIPAAIEKCERLQADVSTTGELAA